PPPGHPRLAAAHGRGVAGGLAADSLAPERREILAGDRPAVLEPESGESGTAEVRHRGAGGRSRGPLGEERDLLRGQHLATGELAAEPATREPARVEQGV